jgi:hypothetical protein
VIFWGAAYHPFGKEFSDLLTSSSCCFNLTAAVLDGTGADTTINEGSGNVDEILSSGEANSG